ncbi:transposase family protein [Streptomyces sp. Ag109_G2-15]|uniref:transposase family protein n=1 Tax=Streptomyces sp. Ag109_G2-15 TaxID=1938850 RepID=UPI0027BA6B5D|nr:transposase family protein [Streptomyces sp. Ag109_G2-15]
MTGTGFQGHGVLDARDPSGRPCLPTHHRRSRPAFGQLREHPGAVPEEIPGLLQRLAEVADPRDPRGVRHTLVVVLALPACAILAGATSLPAVGEWITDAPPSVLERLGVRPDPLSPKRCLPAEATVRRLLGRIRRRRVVPGGGPLSGHRGVMSVCWSAGVPVRLRSAFAHTSALPSAATSTFPAGPRRPRPTGVPACLARSPPDGGAARLRAPAGTPLRAASHRPAPTGSRVRVCLITPQLPRPAHLRSCRGQRPQAGARSTRVPKGPARTPHAAPRQGARPTVGQRSAPPPAGAAPGTQLGFPAW